MMTETTGSGNGASIASDYAIAVEIEVPDILEDRLR